MIQFQLYSGTVRPFLQTAGIYVHDTDIVMFYVLLIAVRVAFLLFVYEDKRTVFEGCLKYPAYPVDK